MQTKLLQGLDDTERKELKENFIHSKLLRTRLIELLTKEINSLQRDMEQEDWLRHPNWDKVQADRIAQIKAQRKIISLLSEKSL